jgi:hypothetical protein
LKPFYRLAFDIAGDAAAGNVASGRKLGQGSANVSQRHIYRCGYIEIKQLAMLLQVFENFCGVHHDSFSWVAGFGNKTTFFWRLRTKSE